MIKVWRCLFLMLAFVASGSFAQSVDKIAEVQDQLMLDLTTLETAHDAEKPFLEDILRRKNQALREEIFSQLSSDKKEGLDVTLAQQVELLQKLLSLNEVKIVSMSRENRSAEGDAKKRLELRIQKRIGMMDVYYQQLAKTLDWSKERDVDVAVPEAELKTALVSRSQYLTNAILYTDTQRQDLERRLSYVSEEEKATIKTELERFSERTSVMVASLEETITLMEPFGVDVTSYKRVLLATTGDINADVLDVDVALDLLDGWLRSFSSWAFDNTPSFIVKLALFLGILYVTRLIANVARKTVRKSVSHSKMDFSVLMQEFFVSIASKAVVFIGLLIALSQIGIELAPLLTGFGVAGVIIGFALQDTLSNFASGLMILIYRPYDVGDMVKVAGVQGTVKDMSLVSTTIQTIDNQRLVIPNNKIWGDVINNITAERVRRVDMVFGIGYSDDIDKAKAVLNDIILAHPLVLKKPEHMIKLHTLNTSSVDFVVRPWVKTDDYWDVYWDVTETVKKRFDEEGITIPFPQRDVHIYNHEES
ncbi:mechanosensitive ion channel family protein [Vibrio splendidus]|uniref:mechanosensitive ion channel family protein n=1 Tax=Vibrio splendidus TaxID=29497 RepID=UPI000D3D94C9|nr:mechanosensitive ion channel family protein [Vibrio splendidus]MCC4877868.1 mechanosensitive ion channel family protein [Vibrio splendidus]PTO58024.1 mechanosensitive ion channel protein [Vibrio splendidus]PTO71194.1 mechanosensitive ion channel protein [Vibrio splendidus]PTP78792.1 mechanosensitive ion channel protein [Vibrio splendidus]PTP95278.1 mechanosensitive ion channel protein [Vibrio splendidus]